MAPAQYRSANFEAVASRLDLGGESFTYTDFGSAMKEAGPKLGELFRGLGQISGNSDPQLMMLGMLPIEQIVDTLGVSNLAAYGASSYWDGSQYHNKSVIQMPDGVKGIFTIIGDSAHDFTGLAMAPATTDVFMEFDFKSRAVEAMIHSVAKTMYGDQSDQFVEGILSAPVSPEGPTWADILAKSNTTATLVMELGEMQSMEMGELGEMSFPTSKSLVRLTGMAWLINDGLIPTEDMQIVEDGDITIYVMPPDEFDLIKQPEGMEQSFATKGTDLYFLNDRDYLKKCLSAKGGLASTPAFKAATQGFPNQGNFLLYVSKESANSMIDFRDSMAEAIPEMKSILPFYDFMFPLMNISKQEKDLACITVVDAQSIYSAARWPVPHSGMGSTGNVMTIGMLSAMAIPAFQKVREQSREKAITNNLRIVASAGMQYILEEGAVSVSYDKLEGEFFQPIEPINGESYRELVISEDGGVLEVTTDSGETITFTY